MPNAGRGWSPAYSLVRMLVVLAIIALMLGGVMPPLRQLTHRARIEGAVRRTAQLLRRARSEAVRQGTNAEVRIDEDTLVVLGTVPSAGGGAGQTLDFFRLPAGVGFWAPQSEDVIDGFTLSGGERLALFEPDGSVETPGAFRFGDKYENYLEARVGPTATAMVQVRKYNKKLPKGSDGTHWYTQDDAQWEWYWGASRGGGSS